MSFGFRSYDEFPSAYGNPVWIVLVDFKGQSPFNVQIRGVFCSEEKALAQERKYKSTGYWTAVIRQEVK